MPGKPDPANASALLDGLRAAAAGCLNGKFSAMVTAPLAKSVIADSGVSFTGHTEFLADVTGAAHPVMMLVAGDLRVALASTHMPLRDVADYLNPEILKRVLRILHTDLRDKFGINDPDIVVCGLNPHAGEDGHLGGEEREFIAPTLDELRDEGLRVRGPMPADTAFTPCRGTQGCRACDVSRPGPAGPQVRGFRSRCECHAGFTHHSHVGRPRYSLRYSRHWHG